ncbi:hypothetical protein J4434_01955 [Candidatus Woesearchaeota archaeon]|nr:hypothetical protein [Candidatus Woesearchaeota archaeon]
MTQDAHGHGGHGNGHSHDKPEIVKQLEEADELIKRITGNYFHVHSHAHSAAIEQLANEGILERDEQGFIKFDKLDEKEAQEKLHEYMMGHFDTFMKNHLKDMWGGLSKQWKEFYRQTLLGVTENNLKQLIDAHGKDYNVEQHKDAHKKALNTIVNQHQSIKMGMVKGEHAKDVLEKYLKVDKEHLGSIDYDILGNDAQMQELMYAHANGHVNDKYIKQQVWYKKDGHDAHAHAGHGHGGH